MLMQSSERPIYSADGFLLGVLVVMSLSFDSVTEMQEQFRYDWDESRDASSPTKTPSSSEE